MSRLRYDISLRWIECLFYWLIHFTRKLKEIYIILSGSRLWINRLYDIGFIERDYVLYFGLTGLLSRSANIWIDGRLLGYESYQNFSYSIFLGTSSDCLDRYILRFNEMIESSRFIYSIMDILFTLDFCSCVYSYCSFSIMELFISTFLITFPFILSFINSLRLSIESSKGIYSIYVGCFPYWATYIISNDFLVIGQLNKFCRCINLGDIITLLGSIDFVPNVQLVNSIDCPFYKSDPLICSLNFTMLPI